MNDEVASFEAYDLSLLVDNDPDEEFEVYGALFIRRALILFGYCLQCPLPLGVKI